MRLSNNIIKEKKQQYLYAYYLFKIIAQIQLFKVWYK